MARTHVLGVPRIGPNRELKFAQEARWRGEIDEAALKAVASGIRQANWRRQHAAGLDFVTVGDFAFYDQMLNQVALLGCAPERFGFGGRVALSEYFQLARGNAACHAMEMTKWFDTNYHYLVPEFKPDTHFALDPGWLFDEVTEAQTAGFAAKPVLIGPLTFLWLGKEKAAGLAEAKMTALTTYKGSLDAGTRFIPTWVKIAVAFALGLGTMVGWRRIVVTVGEKIGKTHLTYAQGASAELVAMATIFGADHMGLPVSTTHVLSSGVAGTMAANGSGLQMATVRNLLMAWVLTLPCSILLAGLLYMVFAQIF